MALKLSAAEAASVAIQSIGCGYDMTLDLSLAYRKRRSLSDSGNNPFPNSRLIEIEEDEGRDIVLPGGLLIPNVPNFIVCEFDKDERTRLQSGVLPFRQMSEQFNQEISLTEKIPSGLFNTMFELSGSWHKDASSTKTLAFDGVFISLYTVALEKSQILLSDHVKKYVPSSWEPALLARFIEKFGTHIIVGVKLGGKDVIYMKQQQASSLKPADVHKKLTAMADKTFLDSNGQFGINSEQISQNDKDLVSICKRRGGSDDKNLKHNEWLHTVQSEPDVITMSFIPITSLLNGVPGSGFLCHAINLYLRYKPPLEELRPFLHFQQPREWAASYDDKLIGPEPNTATLQFSFFGPKIHVNTDLVDVGKSPVTGIRLYLEGKSKDRIGILLQHLSSHPKTFQLEDSGTGIFNSDSDDNQYYQKVDGKNFSHVYTAVRRRILNRNRSTITSRESRVEKSSVFTSKILEINWLCCEWDAPPRSESEMMVADMKESFTGEKYVNGNINCWADAFTDETELMRKIMKVVDTTKVTRGPLDSPGYWVVSGARLVVEKGKISLWVKYCLPRI